MHSMKSLITSKANIKKVLFHLKNQHLLHPCDTEIKIEAITIIIIHNIA